MLDYSSLVGKTALKYVILAVKIFVLILHGVITGVDFYGFLKSDYKNLFLILVLQIKEVIFGQKKDESVSVRFAQICSEEVID